MLKKLYNILNPVIYAMCDVIYFIPFYLAMLNNLTVEMDPSHFILYAFGLNTLISVVIHWCNVKKYQFTLRKIIILGSSLISVFFISMIMDSSNIFILFFNYLFLMINLSFLIRYHENPSDFSFEFKYKVLKRVSFYLIFGFITKIYTPELVSFLDTALNYFIVYLVISLILVGQYKISHVFAYQVGDDSAGEDNPLFEKYRVKKNLIINPEKSIVLNFALQLLVALGLIGTVMYGTNIFYSPFHFVFSKVTNFVMNVIDRLIYYPIMYIYLLVTKWVTWLYSKGGAGLEEEPIVQDQVLEGFYQIERREPGPIIIFISNLLHGLVYVGVVALCAYLIYRVIGKYKEREEVNHDEKEFVYSMKEAMAGINKGIKGLLKRRTNELYKLHPVRKTYIKEIRQLKKQGLVIQPTDTPDKILQKTQQKFEEEAVPLISLTQEYKRVRYGEKE